MNFAASMDSASAPSSAVTPALPAHAGDPDASPDDTLSSVYDAPLAAEQLSRKLQSYEAITASQMRNLEATLEQMLHQATGSIRKDIAAREERLTLRIDTERAQQQAALFELRRDLTAQQTGDLETYDERLARRLDAERREQKSAMTELRKDIGVQQDYRAQLASLQRDLSTTQAALSKLASSRGGPSLELSLPSSDSTAASDSSGSTIAPSSLADLRRDINDLRCGLEGQANAAEDVLKTLRNEIASRDDSMRMLQLQLDHTNTEFARSIQDVVAVVEAMVPTNGASTSGKVCDVPVGADAGPARLDAEQLREISMNVVRDVETAERSLIDELLKRILAVEASMQCTVDGMSTNMDEARSNMCRLSEDIQRERSERCTTLADLSCRTDDAADMARKVREDLANWAASLPALRASEVIDSGELDSVSERAATRDVEGNAHEGGTKGVFGTSSVEQAALVACIGELDAELRVEVNDHIEKVSSQLRCELKEQIVGLERQVKQGTSGSSIIEALCERLQKLEASRLDLRVGALESAAQRGAVFSVAAVQAAAAEQALARVAEMEMEMGLGNEDSSPTVMSNFSFQPSVDPPDLGPELDETQASVQDCVEADARATDSRSEFPEEVRRVHGASAKLAKLSNQFGAHASRNSEGAGHAPQATKSSDIVSGDLKGRLEVLVEKVKATLHANPMATLPAHGVSVPEAPSQRWTGLSRLPQSCGGGSSLATAPPPTMGHRSGEHSVATRSPPVARPASLTFQVAQPPPATTPGAPPPLAVGSVRSMTRIGDPAHLAAPAVTAQSAVALQSGPPVLASVRVTDMQRREVLPPRGATPLRAPRLSGGGASPPALAAPLSLMPPVYPTGSQLTPPSPAVPMP